MTERDPYGEQWDDLSEKDILMGVLTELQQIRLLLQEADADGHDPEPVFECDKCGATVPEDERADHARQEHKAPPEYADKLFTRVIE